MDRWRSLSVLLFKKKTEWTLKQSPAVVILSNFRTLTQLQICAELYTHTFSSIQDQNSLTSDDSYREILTDLFLLFILWALFCTCIQMPFYIGCCIYIPGQAFFLIIILNVLFFFSPLKKSCLHESVFLVVSMYASVTFPSQAKG